jgi:hypothetical protein
MRFLLLVILFVTAIGCGPPPRQYGDAGADRIGFIVEIDRSFLASIPTSSSRPDVRFGVGFGSGIGMRYGASYHHDATDTHLEGLDPESGALILRQRLKRGSNEFAVPLQPDRSLQMRVVRSGGESGQEPIGLLDLTTAERPVRIVLDVNGSSLQ